MSIKKTTGIKSGVAKKLDSYANENPRAADTAEGIANWWLEVPLEEVLPALEVLVEQGLWEKLRRDDRVLYSPIPKSNPCKKRKPPVNADSRKRRLSKRIR